MAVVTLYGQGYQSPTQRVLPEAIYRANPQRPLIAYFPITNGNSAASKLLLGKVPSHAIFLPGGLITHSALTGLTDFDLGFAEDADCLADGLTLASAGTKNPLASVAIADLIKPAWQLAGLSRDPGRELTVTATLKVDAGADGHIHFFMPWVGKL
jgi:hypothetical protein